MQNMELILIEQCDIFFLDAIRLNGKFVTQNIDEWRLNSHAFSINNVVD